MAQKS